MLTLPSATWLGFPESTTLKVEETSQISDVKSGWPRGGGFTQWGKERGGWAGPRRMQQSELRALCTQKRTPTSGAGSLPALGFPHLEEGGSQGRYWALGPPAQNVLMWLTSCNASWSFQPNSHAHLLLFPLLSPGQSQPTVTGHPEFLEYEKMWGN